TLTGSFHKSNYQNTAREDDNRIFSIQGEYLLSKKMDIGARYERKDRDSTLLGEDYTRNLFYLYLKVAY
ncbi:outer membrane beta-barrel protein, partial [Candidatus Venteria ishoeyi]